jgi:hypothetical protein
LTDAGLLRILPALAVMLLQFVGHAERTRLDEALPMLLRGTDIPKSHGETFSLFELLAD